MLRHPSRKVTSEVMAGWGGTHAPLIRRTFAGLREAGIVTSEKGHGGGWTLARPAEQISLWDIQRALAGRGKDSSYTLSPDCLIERVIDASLAEADAVARRAMDESLKAMTLADLDAKVRMLHAASPHITGDLA